VITHNRQDFIRLHRLNPNHAGIIVCRDNANFPALAAKVHAQLQLIESLSGQLLLVNGGD
jgi:hypothetical protein